MTYLTFNGRDSKDFGVYISGSGTFDAPKRDTEAVAVPGRNGVLLFDNGRYENLTITYPAFISQDFAENFDAFKAFMLSQSGYHRLEDTYHPDEYRLASYEGPLAPEVGAINRYGHFDIVFNCKPQRYLKSGETAVTVARDATITNPTLFDASPLLEVYGYGDITLGNGGVVSIADDVLVGDVVVNNGGRYSFTTEPYTESFMYRDGYLENGDIITLAPSDMHLSIATQPNIASITAAKTSGNSRRLILLFLRTTDTPITIKTRHSIRNTIADCL